MIAAKSVQLSNFMKDIDPEKKDALQMDSEKGQAYGKFIRGFSIQKWVGG